jgi:hypothetical protein
MRSCSRIPSIAVISLTLALTDCSFNGGTRFTYLAPTVAISPQITSIAVNSSQLLTATVKNTSSYVAWSVQPSTVPSVSVGTFTPATTDGVTGTYYAPSIPPVYSPSAIAEGAVQGSVILSATVADSPSANLFTKVSITFVVTGPISVHLSPIAVTLPVGGTQQFTGYIVGSTNNEVIWQVNGFAGGGQTIGTITSGGLYTAPTSIPMAGNTITITALSAADGTQAASSVIVLNSP